MKGDENASEGLGKVKERPKKGGEPMNPLKSRMEPLKSLYENIPRRIFKEAGDAEGGVEFTTPPPLCLLGELSRYGDLFVHI